MIAHIIREGAFALSSVVTFRILACEFRVLRIIRTCAEHLAGLCDRSSCPKTHEDVYYPCPLCHQSVRLLLLPYTVKVGMYGRVSFHSFYCEMCQSTKQLALKVTSHETEPEISRNTNEAAVWLSIVDIPGIVPLLHHQAFGSCYLFFMPRMLSLTSLRDTVLTYSYKLNIIKSVFRILTELLRRGFAYPDGGCKQLLIDPDSKQPYLCDFGSVVSYSSDTSSTFEALKIVIWELRVDFKGHAEKLKLLESANSLNELGLLMS